MAARTRIPKRDAPNAEDRFYDNHVASDLESSITGELDEYPESTDSETIL